MFLILQKKNLIIAIQNGRVSEVAQVVTQTKTLKLAVESNILVQLDLQANLLCKKTDSLQSILRRKAPLSSLSDDEDIFSEILNEMHSR